MITPNIQYIVLTFILLSSTAVLAQSHTQNGTDNGGQTCPKDFPGFTLNGNDCKVLCRSARWIDIFLFFVGNYAAHAATVPGRPGQSTISAGSALLIALLLPGASIQNGIRIIVGFAVLQPTPLRAAASAGAICAITKTPISADTDGGEDMGHLIREKISMIGAEERELKLVFNLDSPLRSEQSGLSMTRVHGRCELPKGYQLVVVQRDATFDGDYPLTEEQLPFYKRYWKNARRIFKPSGHTVISCNYNFTKSMISMAQLFFSAWTLYRTRVDQIDHFGYAAFGLTVAPYAWMSAINLLANLACPQYNCVYIAESEALRELNAWRELESTTNEERERYKVEGVVGTLDSRSDVYLRSHQGKPQKRSIWRFLLTFVAAAVPLAIVGAISSFRPGQSTVEERAWTMAWLACGAVGLIWRVPAEVIERRPFINSGDTKRHLVRFVYMCVILACGVPSIGGMVIVGRMIRDFGVCQWLG